MWLVITIIVFLFARWLCNKLKNPLANPLLLSVIILISLLMLTGVPYPAYAKDTSVINFLLQPAVVALAYPLYEQLPQIRANWRVILAACTIGSVMSMISTGLIAVALNTDNTLIAALLPKSVTTPIAMEITSSLGGEASITAILVVIAGLFGAVCAYPVYKRLNITHPIAKGLTMGAVSHALGTATSAEKAPQDAAFSSLALVLCGIITSILAPTFYTLALWFADFIS
ncbi:Inner membrane protein YohK [Vibrio aerogenes CECT 7868]|uniref:Inner membrane protein YohK n=1 Tax=Vibrio aerogenes CECT 7868 TaxID=1216006 RepID=A0A1M5XUU3_9VIBR|nr:LrgB family protein [Vibrio aerogenes]SHI03567.1 Inner membrane protein YohK [Vibrio aerogenes CECT 7868]